MERPIKGHVDGADVELRSVVTEKEDGNSLVYTFTGIATRDTIAGSLDLGEYLKAH